MNSVNWNEIYFQSDEYKEWLRLAHLNVDNRKVGYWVCYYKDGKIVYEYVSDQE